MDPSESFGMHSFPYVKTIEQNLYEAVSPCPGRRLCSLRLQILGQTFNSGVVILDRLPIRLLAHLQVPCHQV